MRKDLRQPLPPPQWPEGIELCHFSQGLLPQIHALLTLGYAAGQGHVEPLEQWQQNGLHDAEFDPQLCFICLLDGEVIGVALAWTSAYLKDLVVHPRLQGHGLGSALLNQVFDAFKQRGEACVDLKVMEHNHPARQLYRKHGLQKVLREAV